MTARAHERSQGRRHRSAGQGGFTLLEVIIVLSVMAALAGTIVPLVSASKRAEGIDAARAELEAIANALSAHYYELGTFPSRLDQAGFYGVYALPGVGDARLRDEWGARNLYRVVLTRNPDTATVYSVGDNGRDDGAAAETIKVTVYGARPGGERTRERMNVISAALARHIRAGGTITGVWNTDRAALGLGAAYARDAFGTAFRLNAALLLRSAGPDRRFGNADDLTL